MKTKLIAAVTAIIALSSCSVYRSGQTPDDVYYSPGRGKEQAAYVQADDARDDGKRYNNQPSYNGYDDYATPDDRWLMMRVRNRSRWSYFDDYNYYNPYNNFGYNGFGGYGSYGFGYQPGFSFGLGFGSYDPFGYSMFNNYYNWNSYYNPYYPKVIVVNPKTDPGAYNRIRSFNLNSYSNSNYNNNRSVMRPNGRANGYNNSNNTLGNSFRRVFSNSSTTTAPRPSRGSNEDYYRSSSQDRPVRTYSPSSNSSNNSTYSPRSNSGNSSGSSSGSSSGGSSGSRPNRR
ncbi:MAG TPA: hypothetical protein VM101_07700 [Flavitalea sp.]|nr:hypothetical protein [Flavitalea sp.]